MAVTENTKQRFFSLDLLKAISIAAVVSFHSILVPEASYASSQVTIEILFSPLRFCVPIFLTISFLLFHRSLEKHQGSQWDAIKKRLTRILIPTIFWLGITALLKLNNGNSWFDVGISILKGKIFTGSYYLLVLIQFIPAFVIFRHWLIKPLNVLTTIAVQVIIFFWIYTLPSSPNSEQILVVLRNIDRPLFIYWFVYIALGAYFWQNWSSIVKWSDRINWKYKITALIIYSIIQMLEFTRLFTLFSGNIFPFEYLTFSCISSVFVMFLCLASIQEEQLHSSAVYLVKMLSKYSLGIFCIQGIICQIFNSILLRLLPEVSFNLGEIIMIKLTTWFLLLSISLGLSILLDRIGLKSVVR